MYISSWDHKNYGKYNIAAPHFGEYTLKPNEHKFISSSKQNMKYDEITWTWDRVALKFISHTNRHFPKLVKMCSTRQNIQVHQKMGVENFQNSYIFALCILKKRCVGHGTEQ